MIRQQGLKDAPTLRSNPSPSPVLEEGKDRHPGTERETGAETRTDTTGTGARCERETETDIGTDEILGIVLGIATNTARTRTAWFRTTGPTGTGTPIVAGTGLSSHPGSGSGTITTPEMIGVTSGGDTVTRTERIGVGSRRAESPGR